MESGFATYVCNIKLFLEAYTAPTHLQKEPDCVMYVYRVSQEERTKLRESVPYVKL